MDRQKMLDNFLKIGVPAGPCTGVGTYICRYIKDGHVGCAIGCQPGFREQFGKKVEAWEQATQGGDIRCLLNKFPEIEPFFDLDPKNNDEDFRFLTDLQEMHDQDEWKPNKLPKERVEDFCKTWRLSNACV